MDNSVLVILIAAGVFVVLFFLLYNSLVAKRNNVDNAFAAIDVQLKKRCDLIPNLVSSVKTYMTHEASVLTKIAELRSRAMKTDLSPEERVSVNNEISGSIRTLMVQAENYPDLKATESFQHLNRTLNEIEEQLSAARRSYNAGVTEFNTAIQIFPYVLFAGIMGFRRRELLTTPEAERANPNVGNLFKQ